MLAKSRSDIIARRAALTAPTWFLPRLLLCSGLPRASLLTMIDRLGIMGDKQGDGGKVFQQLLVPSATSEWDTGRLGNRREVARKLLGRLSAYLRMNNVVLDKGETEISTSFLTWLSKECTNTDKPKKKLPKQKAKIPEEGITSLSDTLSILSTLKDPMEEECDEGLPEEDLEMDDFLKKGADSAQSDGSSSHMIDASEITYCMEKQLPDRLEKGLTQYDQRRQAKQFLSSRSLQPTKGDILDEKALATLLVENYMKFEKQLSLTRLVMGWVPHLSRGSGCPDLWQLLFSAKSDAVLNETLDALVQRCIASWCNNHIASCYEWILAQSKSISHSKLKVSRMADFLVLTSGQHSVAIDSFSSRICVKSVASWGKSEDFVKSAAAIAFECMNQANADGLPAALIGRNNTPGWLLLLQMLAKCGRSQMKFVCESVLERISKGGDEATKSVLRAVILRLYVSNPFGMNLGIAIIRAVLMEAAEQFSSNWVDWRCPLDGQLEDMLDAVMSGSGQRLVRPLIDISKKHPLLLLRRSRLITQFLEEDATVRGNRSAQEKRGIVHGRSDVGQLEADASGGIVKVHVKHWGYSYTEPVWIALLDIICAGKSKCCIQIPK